MSIDTTVTSFITALNANTEALNANTEAMNALLAKQGGATAAASTADATASTKEDATPRRGRRPAADKAEGAKAEVKKSDAYEAKHTVSEMQAAVNEVKNELGTAEAKRLIKEVGGHDRLADVVDPKKVDELYEAAKALLESGNDEDDDI